MSPPHCHSGNSDNGTPAFSNTSSSITPGAQTSYFQAVGSGGRAIISPAGRRLVCWLFWSLLQSEDVLYCVLTFSSAPQRSGLLHCCQPGYRLVGDGTASVKGCGGDTTKAFATSSAMALAVSLLFPGSSTEAPLGLLERRLMNFPLTLNLIIFCHCESQQK